MAGERIYRVARLTDKQVIRLFKSILELYPDSEALFMLGNGIRISLDEFEKEKFPRTSYMMISATFTARAQSISLDFKRGISGHSFNERVPSAIADELQLAANIGQHHNTTISDLVAISQLIEKFTSGLEHDVADNLLSPTLVLDAKLASLTDLAADLIAGADKKRRELDSLKDKVEADFQAKRQEFSLEESQLRREVAGKAKAVEDLRAELDDREHKHVRRALRETITSQIQDSLGKHSGSSFSRIYSMQVTMICLAGAVATGFFAYWTQSIISSELTLPIYSENGTIIGQQLAAGFQIYMLYLKLFLSSAASIGFVAYAISWVRKLSIQEAAHSHDLEQYMFDMNRASWTIETILELTDAELEEVPSVWLNSVCRNLFERQDQKQDEATSLQALAALLNVTTEAEIGPGGPTFKLNRRAVKKAAASAE